MPRNINTEKHRKLTTSTVYPKQRRNAQRSYVRAVSRKFVPVQGILLSGKTKLLYRACAESPPQEREVVEAASGELILRSDRLEP